MVFNAIVFGCIILFLIYLYESGSFTYKCLVAVSFVAFNKGRNVIFRHCSGTLRRVFRFHNSHLARFTMDLELTKGNMSVEFRDEQGRTLGILDEDHLSFEAEVKANIKYTFTVRFKNASGTYTLDWF